MIGPTYVHVLEGSRALRVVICRRSQRPQIVRIGGAGLPSKVSTIDEFPKVEVRPNHHHPIDVEIPAQVYRNYWLAIQVFSYDSQGWSQSLMRSISSLQVPVEAQAF